MRTRHSLRIRTPSISDWIIVYPIMSLTSRGIVILERLDPSDYTSELPWTEDEF